MTRVVPPGSKHPGRRPAHQPRSRPLGPGSSIVVAHVRHPDRRGSGKWGPSESALEGEERITCFETEATEKSPEASRPLVVAALFAGVSGAHTDFVGGMQCK